MSLKNLAKSYSDVELEDACSLVLHITAQPQIKNIQTTLKSNAQRKRPEVNPQLELKPSTSSHSFVRGASYYGGINK